MGADQARRLALVLWAACAFVTWNVAFDRSVYFSAVRYTQDQIQRHDRGERVSSIDEAFSPELVRAAWSATIWGGAVLVAGVTLVALVSRRGR